MCTVALKYCIIISILQCHLSSTFLLSKQLFLALGLWLKCHKMFVVSKGKKERYGEESKVKTKEKGREKERKDKNKNKKGKGIGI